MDVTKTCRDTEELNPLAKTALTLLIQECVKAGITSIFVTETYRSPERQRYLYGQGRTRPGSIVTWTLSSNHANRMAWDIACSSPYALYDASILNKVGAVARKLGITWGGDWSNNIDRPHFEIKSTWKIPVGYKIEGEVTIPTDSKIKASITKGVEDELNFTSATLKAKYDSRQTSPGTAELINDAAQKYLGYTSKLKDGKLSDGDLNALSIELAVYFAKQNK